MADPVFFPPPAPLTIAEIASLTGASPARGADAGRQIRGVAALAAAGPEDISFFENARFTEALADTRAGACFCAPRDLAHVPAGTVGMTTDKPHDAFTRIAAVFYPSALRPALVFGEHGISPAAHIHRDASIELGVTIEAGAVVGPRAAIGSGTVIAAGSIIGPDVRIGRDVSIGPAAVVTHALVGNRVIIHAGVSIGQDGFGFIAGSSGPRKIVQLGRVIIQDDVEVGANTTVDRGSNRDTVIGEGTKIDNLVQVGHNVVVGRNCLLAGQVGVSGSVTIGDFTVLGGKVGVRDNVRIGKGATIAASSAVGTDVPDGARWGGIPARPIKEWLRESSALRRLTMRRGSAAQHGEAPDDNEGGSTDDR